MSSTSVRSIAKKAPKQQRPIERTIVIKNKSANDIITILNDNPVVEELQINDCYDNITEITEITSEVISRIFALEHLTGFRPGLQQYYEHAAEIATNFAGSSITN